MFQPHDSAWLPDSPHKCETMTCSDTDTASSVNREDQPLELPHPPHVLVFCGRVAAVGVIVIASVVVALSRAVPSVFAQFATSAPHRAAGLPPIAQRSDQARTQAAAPMAKCISRIGLVVDDLDRSIEFYRDVLTFTHVSETEVTGEWQERLHGVFGVRMRIAVMQLGDEQVELTEYLAPKGRPYPADSRSNDRWFQHIAIITGDMDGAYARLRKHKVRHASTGPQLLPEWNANAAGIRAFYFHDPDGHVLEVLQFPPGKGSPKWHERTLAGKLFLGIDHTAIVVNDTEQSLQFYRDALGMEVVGRSENYGVEQEHLNNVFGARLRITTLRPLAGSADGHSSRHESPGPAIEFLEYLTPRDGRPYPPDARANDLIAWQTTIVTSDIESAAAILAAHRAAFISPGVISTASPSEHSLSVPAVAQSTLDFRPCILVRDPDGHIIRLIQP
jgi:catechol 2,3-dioxygenase-like lactoylglutathione lyase family enzyme